MNYGKAVRTGRASRDLTQRGLAKKIGKAASYISLIESGERKPSLDTLESIANALRIPLPLLTLLAADEKDSNRLSESEMRFAGARLLSLLTQSGPVIA